MSLRTSYRQISQAEISAENKFLRLILKVYSPKELAVFINEPAEVFFSATPLVSVHKGIDNCCFKVVSALLFITLAKFVDFPTPFTPQKVIE